MEWFESLKSKYSLQPSHLSIIQECKPSFKHPSSQKNYFMYGQFESFDANSNYSTDQIYEDLRENLDGNPTN